MYYVMLCLSSFEKDHAVISHKQDHPFRSWHSGERFIDNASSPSFERPPLEPIKATIEPGDEGMLAEFWDNPVPLITRRLVEALRKAGVDNIDTYAAEIHGVSSGVVNSDYVAVNIVGKIAAADLKQSSYDPDTGPAISRDFDSLAIDEGATRGTLLFRLAESVNAIIVHEKVKKLVESAGISTLTFLRPENWAG